MHLLAVAILGLLAVPVVTTALGHPKQTVRRFWTVVFGILFVAFALQFGPDWAAWAQGSN